MYTFHFKKKKIYRHNYTGNRVLIYSMFIIKIVYYIPGRISGVRLINYQFFIRLNATVCSFLNTFTINLQLFHLYAAVAKII